MKLVLRKDVVYALKDAGWNCRNARNGKKSDGGVMENWLKVTLSGHEPDDDGYRDVQRIVKATDPKVEMVIVEYENFLTSNAKSVVPAQVEHFEQAELFSTIERT